MYKSIIVLLCVSLFGVLCFSLGKSNGKNDAESSIDETEQYCRYCEEVIYCQDSLINNQLEIMACSEVHYYNGMKNIDSLMTSHTNLVNRIKYLKSYKK